MKDRIILFLAVTGLTAFLASCAIPRHAAIPIPKPDSVATLGVSLDDYKEKYSKYDGVFLDSRTNVAHTLFAGDWTTNYSHLLRFVILKPDEEWITTFRLDLEGNQRLAAAWIYVIPPNGGAPRAYGAKNFVVESNSNGGTTYKFAYPDVMAGTVIYEGYEIASDAETRHTIPLQFTVPCEKLTVRYSYPSSISFAVKDIALNTRPRYSVENLDNRYKAMVIEKENIPALKNEPYSPYDREIMEYFQVAATSVNGYRSLVNWHDYAEDFMRYAIDKEQYWEDAPGEVVEEIVSEGMTDYEKMDTIVTWVQNSVEVDFRGTGDFDFNDVINEKRGNFYMINGLTRAMLEKAGIKASMLLAHDAQDGYFDGKFVVHGELIIPAVYVSLGEKDYIMMPHVENYPVDLVPEYLQGQEALRIDDAGSNGFFTIPTASLADNTVEETYDLKVDENGLIEVSESKSFRGSSAWMIRQRLRGVKDEQMENLMKSILTYDDGDIELKKWEIEHREDYKQPLVVRLTYTIDNLVTVTPDEVLFQTGGLFSPTSNLVTKVQTDDRVNPIRVYFNERYVKRITIETPEGWELSNVRDNVNYSNVFGGIKSEWKIQRGGVAVEQERLLKRTEEPAEKYDELLAVTGVRSKLYIPTLIYSVDGGGMVELDDVFEEVE